MHRQELRSCLIRKTCHRSVFSPQMARKLQMPLLLLPRVNLKRPKRPKLKRKLTINRLMLNQMLRQAKRRNPKASPKTPKKPKGLREFLTSEACSNSQKRTTIASLMTILTKLCLHLLSARTTVTMRSNPSTNSC